MVGTNSLRPSRARQNLLRSNFEKAFPLMGSIHGPGALSSIVRARTYVQAILADERVRSAAH
jgi:hypothetical protein